MAWGMYTSVSRIGTVSSMVGIGKVYSIGIKINDQEFAISLVFTVILGFAVLIFLLYTMMIKLDKVLDKSEPEPVIF